MELKEILALDQAAREMVKEAQKTADAIDSETPAKVQALREEHMKKARESIEEFEQQQKAFAAERTKEAKLQVQVHRKRLDEQYASKGDAWLNHIVSAVTEV